MTAYVHLARYGKPRGDEVADVWIGGDALVYFHGRPWNLRDGSKGGFHEGFEHAPDGRYLRYGAGNAVEIVHPDGRAVNTGLRAVPYELHWVGEHLVVGEYSAPLIVIDASGKQLGTFEGQKDLTASVVGSPDGKTLWVAENDRVVQFDLARRTIVRTIAAPKGQVFRGGAVLSSGLLVLIACDADSEEGDDDLFVVYEPSGKKRAEIARLSAAGIAALGEDRFVVADAAQRCFRVFSSTLEQVAEVPMFSPERRPYADIKALPSGREWISVGGRGEWDHYGVPGLGPKTGASAPAKAKPAAKKAKPAAKKAKPAAKKAKPAAKVKPAAKKKR